MSRSASPTSSISIHDAIAANRRNTNLLMGGFVLTVGVVVFAAGVVLGLPPDVSGIVAAVGAGISVVIAWLLYRSSDSIVLGISEAKQVTREQYPELFRTVENLCIGAGLPMPKVYVIQDGAINAFATGRDPHHASIAVTTGLLQKTEKLELEGVIGHELSHVGNYDTRLMMVTAVLVGLIAILVDVMLRMTWYGAGARKRYKGKGEGGAGVLLLIGAIVALVLAPIVARLIQLAVSRQREYLADASSALLTRYPAGLAGALEKISKDDDPLDVATKGTAHLFIADPFKGNESSLNSLFQTHPPIAERIARLRAM
ncbi:MAG: M48 family metallopeptidase [SAR202 cluster bacterium]|nr:M48 family metallopeptidase [SAR202 cluster bacterium]